MVERHSKQFREGTYLNCKPEVQGILEKIHSSLARAAEESVCSGDRSQLRHNGEGSIQNVEEVRMCAGLLVDSTSRHTGQA